MRNVTCRGCDNNIRVIDLRVAHYDCKGYECPNCDRTWTFDQLDELLNTVDLRRFRKKLHRKLDKGAVCPCCDRHAKRYRRKFNSIMACWLIAFFRAHLDEDESDYIHVSRASKYLHSGVSVRSGDYGKARFWELLESSDEQEPGKKDVGKWKLTQKGREFVKGALTIPRSAVVYNNVVQGFEGDQITIQDALHEKFDYDELMAVPPPARV